MCSWTKCSVQKRITPCGARCFPTTGKNYQENGQEFHHSCLLQKTLWGPEVASPFIRSTISDLTLALVYKIPTCTGVPLTQEIRTNMQFLSRVKTAKKVSQILAWRPLCGWIYQIKLTKGKVHRKKSKKKITSVSFAFTHTYTLEKITLLLSFPKRKGRLTKKRFAKMWGGEGDTGCFF